jgi:nucleotide-binding universal stress UspA family protein
MTSARPIVAAIDPHRADLSPAALGLLLAKITGERLVLASAYALDAAFDPLYPEYAQFVRAATERALEPTLAWAAMHAGATVGVSTAVVADAGSPATALHKLAARTDASMIVVGSSPRGPIGRVLPGAVTDRLLHSAPCPVAVATTGFSPGELRRVGVAFVDRADGWAALTRGWRLAEAAGARVRVLTVREPLDPRFVTPLAADQVGEMDRARSEAAERTLRAGVGAVAPSCSAGGEVLVGRPCDALATASEDLDLLVCGSRGYGPVRTLLLGGVSHALVRHAACPVLVVPLGDRLASAPTRTSQTVGP